MTTLLPRKVCLLGDFAVGKTSTVMRFVRSTFSESYHTTIGVKVDTRTIALDAERSVRMVLWDIAGSSVLDQTRVNYVRGAHGLILVADGTRARTLASALDIWKQACDTLERDVPATMLINKFDLVHEWEVSPETIEGVGRHLPVFNVSAKQGTQVESAFENLAGRMWT